MVIILELQLIYFLSTQNGNKGIAVGLNNIQLVEKGEPLGGASAAEDDFDELDTDDEDFL